MQVDVSEPVHIYRSLLWNCLEFGIHEGCSARTRMRTETIPKGPRSSMSEEGKMATCSLVNLLENSGLGYVLD